MVSVKADNKAAIQVLCVHKAKPGSYLLDEIHKLSRTLSSYGRSGCLLITLSWISGHDDVAGNEEADREAKLAVSNGSSPEAALPCVLRSSLPLSVSAVRQGYKSKLDRQWRVAWSSSPRYVHALRIDPRLPAGSFLLLVRDISRAQASTIFQLRSRHAPLRKYLYRIGKADSPACPCCEQGVESVHHFLFNCPAHSCARFGLARALGRKSKSIRYVLGDKKAITAVCIIQGMRLFILKKNKCLVNSISPSI